MPKSYAETDGSMIPIGEMKRRMNEAMKREWHPGCYPLEQWCVVQDYELVRAENHTLPKWQSGQMPKRCQHMKQLKLEWLSRDGHYVEVTYRLRLGLLIKTQADCGDPAEALFCMDCIQAVLKAGEAFVQGSDRAKGETP